MVSVQRSNTSSAAYAFALVGGCAKQEAPLLTANELLQATRPTFPVIAMVTPSCWLGPRIRRIRQARMQPIALQAVGAERVNCTGRFRGLPMHFQNTYAIFGMFGLTQYAALLYLDTDLAILSNLDHLLLGLLAAPSDEAQIWTPQECKSFRPRQYNFNTGVWGIRPNLQTNRELMDFVASGRHRCHIGFQTAATSFFGTNRWEAQAQLLDVRYNLKPDHGFESCLWKRSVNLSQVQIVHWSGWRKPWGLRNPYPFEAESYRRYMLPFCFWDSTLNSSMVEHVKFCGVKGKRKDCGVKFCETPAARAYGRLRGRFE